MTDLNQARKAVEQAIADRRRAGAIPPEKLQMVVGPGAVPMMSAEQETLWKHLDRLEAQNRRLLGALGDVREITTCSMFGGCDESCMLLDSAKRIATEALEELDPESEQQERPQTGVPREQRPAEPWTYPQNSTERVVALEGLCTRLMVCLQEIKRISYPDKVCNNCKHCQRFTVEDFCNLKGDFLEDASSQACDGFEPKHVPEVYTLAKQTLEA